MSDRFIHPPEQAFGSLLSELAFKVSTLERRIRWPGSTRFVENLDTVTVPSDGEWHTLCTAPLDRGQWVIHGSASVDPGIGAKLIEIRIRDSSSLPSGTTSTYLSTLTILGSLNLSLTSAAVLEGRIANTGTDFDVVQSFLIAVPA